MSPAERACVRRFITLVTERVPDLQDVWLYGSAARGDMWPEGYPIHSNIDLLFLTAGEVPVGVKDDLINSTYQLFLECGRQLGPNFRTLDDFARRVREEGLRLR